MSWAPIPVRSVFGFGPRTHTPHGLAAHDFAVAITFSRRSHSAETPLTWRTSEPVGPPPVSVTSNTQPASVEAVAAAAGGGDAEADAREAAASMTVAQLKHELQVMGLAHLYVGKRGVKKADLVGMYVSKGE